MTKSEFELYIENIEALDRMRNSLDSLTIEWETDVEKMDLSVLLTPLSIDYHPGIVLKIETFEMKDIIQSNGALLREGGVERILNLFKLIESGIKIIPPIIDRDVEYFDGVAQIKNHVKPFSVRDGVNRLNLARHQKLEQIPILVFEHHSKYYFTRSKWDISASNESVVLSEKSTRDVIELPLNRSQACLTASGDYLFYIH